MKKDFLFTCESVTEGHPAKLCDRISDAIVDRFLQQDPYSRIVTECAVATSIVFLAARFASDAVVDLTATARKTIRQGRRYANERVGYHQADFNSKTCSIITRWEPTSQRWGGYQLNYLVHRLKTDLIPLLSIRSLLLIAILVQPSRNRLNQQIQHHRPSEPNLLFDRKSIAHLSYFKTLKIS
jgi:hypothetical protein